MVLVLVISMMFAPSLVLAQGPLVSPDCGQIGADGKLVECGWKDLMSLVNRTVNFILVILSLPIATIMFAYAGFLMMVPGGESAGKKTKAKNIFFNTVIGLLLVAGSWLIIHTLLEILGHDGSWIGF